MPILWINNLLNTFQNDIVLDTFHFAVFALRFELTDEIRRQSVKAPNSFHQCLKQGTQPISKFKHDFHRAQGVPWPFRMEDKTVFVSNQNMQTTICLKSKLAYERNEHRFVVCLHAKDCNYLRKSCVKIAFALLAQRMRFGEPNADNLRQHMLYIISNPTYIEESV